MWPPSKPARSLGLEVLNAACPGETTASFLDTSAPSNGCHAADGYRTRFPVHVAYEAAGLPQLDPALDLLAEHDDVELVRLRLGRNDSALCHPAPDGVHRSGRSGGAGAVQGDVDVILRTLRENGGYDGQIVVVTYCALDYADEAATRLGTTDVSGAGCRPARARAVRPRPPASARAGCRRRTVRRRAPPGRAGSARPRCPGPRG